MKRVAIAMTIAVALVIALGVGKKNNGKYRNALPSEKVTMKADGEYNTGIVSVRLPTGFLDEDPRNYIAQPGELLSIHVDCINLTDGNIPDRPEWERTAKLVDHKGGIYSTINVTSTTPAMTMRGGDLRRVTIHFAYVDNEVREYTLQLPYGDVLIEFTNIGRQVAMNAPLPPPKNLVRIPPSVRNAADQKKWANWPDGHAGWGHLAEKAKEDEKKGEAPKLVPAN